MFNRLKIIIYFAFFCIITLPSCELMDKENSVAQELLRPVKVSISGTVASSDTGNAVSGIEVRIKRVLGSNAPEYIMDGTNAELVATTNASGQFSFDEFIELDVDTYQHYLELSDPDDNYYTNDAQVIYSIRDAELSFNSLKLVSKNPRASTIVRGTIRNVLSDAAVPDVAVKLTHATDSSIIFNAASGADGTFAIESVDVSEYTLNINGSALTTPFVIEETTVKLVGGEENNLGSIRIAPAINADDLRVVLQWNQSAGLDLDIYYNFPKPNLDFNHLGTKTYDMGASDFSMNPSYGFAEDTAYWPENMGGEARVAVTDRDEPGRYTLNKNAGTTYTDAYWPGDDNKFIVGGETIAELDRNSTDGSAPEVLTIHKKNFLSSYPSRLSYYYNYVKNGTIMNY